MNTKYQALQKSPEFQAVSAKTQEIILSKNTLSEACRELQLQLSNATDSEKTEISQIIRATEPINAMAQIGIKGHDVFELSLDQFEKLIEIDPATYHPESTKPTPNGLKAWDAIFREKLGENYKEELRLIK